MTWRRVDSGCDVPGSSKENVQYPCEEGYRYLESVGEPILAHYRTTREAHAKMPDTVRSLAELDGLDGVIHVWPQDVRIGGSA